MVLSRPALVTMVAALLWSAEAAADRSTTQDALYRTQEILELRIDDGTLRKPELLPALVVSTRPRYEGSQGWFEAEALSVLISVFGTDDLRSCEACMQPRVFAEEGRIEQTAGPIGLDEIIRLDTAARGAAKPARTAIWLDEHAAGVSLKIVDLSTARIVFAKNIDPTLRENADTEDMMRVSEELERRARGDSLTHVFADIVILPGQHISLDWTDQWGETNDNFTGLTISLFDPVVGLGMVYYRVIDVFKIGNFRFAPQLGAKVIVSVPTAIVANITDEGSEDLIDPLLTGVFVLRLPFGGSNYGLVATASTNGSIGIGISLLNISLLPVIP